METTLTCLQFGAAAAAVTPNLLVAVYPSLRRGVCRVARVCRAGAASLRRLSH